MTGSDGRRVDGAEAASSTFIVYDEPPPVVPSPRQKMGQNLLIGVGLLEVALLLLFVGSPDARTLGWLALSGAATFVPASVALSERGIRNRLVHFGCLVLAALPGLPWLAATAFLYLIDGYKNSPRTFLFLAPLAMALLRLAVPVCLYGRPLASSARRAGSSA